MSKEQNVSFGLSDCKICGAQEGDEGVGLMSWNHIYGPTMSDSCELEFEVRCVYCGLSVDDEYAEEAIKKWNKLNGLY